MDELRAEVADFYESLRADFDVALPMRWQYSLRSVPTPQMESVMEYLSENGYIDVEGDFNDIDFTPDELDDSTLFSIGFAYVGIHTVQSAADQIVELHQYAEREGIVMEDWSAGIRD